MKDNKMTELIKTSPVIGAQKKMNPIIGVECYDV